MKGLCAGPVLGARGTVPPSVTASLKDRLYFRLQALNAKHCLPFRQYHQTGSLFGRDASVAFSIHSHQIEGKLRIDLKNKTFVI